MELNGTYLGFAPTDESDAGVGELEVVFDDEIIRFRAATGLEVDTEEIPRSELRKMSIEELSGAFGVAASDLDDVTAFMIGDDGPIFVSASPDQEEPNMSGIAIFRLYGEDIDAIFGPSILFTPEQIAAGQFDRAIESIETEHGDPGAIPRLANNGQRMGG